MDILKKNNHILRAVAGDGFWEAGIGAWSFVFIPYFWNSADA